MKTLHDKNVDKFGVDCLKVKNSFEIYDDGIFLQETVKMCDEDKILDDNIEAVKKELNSFLIDSMEKASSEVSERENKENVCDETSMVVDSKDGQLEESLLSQSDISFVQHHSEFESLAEYSDSILPYMLKKERNYMPNAYYMNNQEHINSRMRSILVDWLVDVVDDYNIKDETLFLAINYIDRYVALCVCARAFFS